MQPKGMSAFSYAVPASLKLDATEQQSCQDAVGLLWNGDGGVWNGDARVWRIDAAEADCDAKRPIDALALALSDGVGGSGSFSGLWAQKLVDAFLVDFSGRDRTTSESRQTDQDERLEEANWLQKAASKWQDECRSSLMSRAKSGGGGINASEAQQLTRGVSATFVSAMIRFDESSWKIECSARGDSTLFLIHGDSFYRFPFVEYSSSTQGINSLKPCDPTALSSFKVDVFGRNEIAVVLASDALAMFLVEVFEANVVDFISVVNRVISLESKEDFVDFIKQCKVGGRWEIATGCSIDEDDYGVVVFSNIKELATADLIARLPESLPQSGALGPVNAAVKVGSEAAIGISGRPGKGNILDVALRSMGVIFLVVLFGGMIWLHIEPDGQTVPLEFTQQPVDQFDQDATSYEVAANGVAPSGYCSGQLLLKKNSIVYRDSELRDSVFEIRAELKTWSSEGNIAVQELNGGVCRVVLNFAILEERGGNLRIVNGEVQNSKNHYVFSSCASDRKEIGRLLPRAKVTLRYEWSGKTHNCLSGEFIGFARRADVGKQ